MKYAKHIYVLGLIATIPTNTRGMSTEDACQAFDHLFGYIHEHWARPLTAIPADGLARNLSRTVENQHEFNDCYDLLRNTDTASLLANLETLPPHYAEHIFPVAVARLMLRDLNMPIDHRQCKTFTEFHHRYAVMILA